MKGEVLNLINSLSIIHCQLSIDNGARLGWLIDPQNQQVEIYRKGHDIEVLVNPTHLSGEDVLPGFILDLKRIL